MSLRLCVIAGLLSLASASTLAAQPAVPAALTTADASDLAAGRRVFDAQCAWCHGTEGAGGSGPDLQRATLRHAADDDALIRIVRSGIPGTEMPSFAISLTEKSSWQAAAYVRSLGRTQPAPIPGDSRRGARVYEKAGCALCHVVSGIGGVLGPELTSIGALRGAVHLRESIVKPEAAHPPGYLVVRAVTEAGIETRGIRLAEDVFWIHIRDASGAVRTFEKAALTQLERQLQATLMPAYGAVFPADQLDDLVAYLAGLRGVR